MTQHRPDIAAALKSVSAVKAKSYRSLKFLPNFVSEDEGVLHIAITKTDGGEGLLVLTPTRLVFFRQQITRTTHEDFQLDQITAVDWRGRMATGTLSVTAAGATAEFPKILRTDGEAMASALRTQVAAAKNPSAPATTDIASALSRLSDLHAAGHITDDEYAAAKAQALGA